MIPPVIHDQRIGELENWLRQQGELDVASLASASADASFRRYFRVQGNDCSYIVMDAPPEHEDCLPFIRVAEFLARMQLNAPRIIQADLQRGFLLLTDLGHRQYLDVLRENAACAPALYNDALAALLQMQSRGRAFQTSLPGYDEKLLRDELALFRQWLCEAHLGIEFGQDLDAQWRETCDVLTRNALGQPQVFVHRDFHSRNLMLTENDNPGILDFQDAVEGPLSYDLVSLLKDCYIDWPEAHVDSLVATYFDTLEDTLKQGIDLGQFQNAFELMGVQRHLKAAGIFARLSLRDGKHGYLQDIPRTLRYIVAVEQRQPQLAPLIALIREHCLPALPRAFGKACETTGVHA